MDEKYSGYGQIPPELQKKFGISGEGVFIDPEKVKRRVRFYIILGLLPFIIIGGLIASISIFIFPYTQEQLFREIEYDPQDVFAQMTFLKSHIAAEREGNVFVFIVDQVGAAGFDTTTGE